MKRTLWVNYGLDVLLCLTSFTLALSALLVWVVLPKGYHPSWLLWIAIHKWSGLVLVAEVLVILHIGWLTRMTRRLFRIPRIPKDQKYV